MTVRHPKYCCFGFLASVVEVAQLSFALDQGVDRFARMVKRAFTPLAKRSGTGLIMVFGVI